MKTLVKFVPLSVFTLVASLTLVGCGSSSSTGGTGGAMGSGGSGSGGTPGSGGSGSGGSGSGGATGSGGSGSGGAVTDGGSDTSTDTGTDAADDAGGGTMAQATIVATGGGTITGTVTFVTVTGGVQVTYALENCPPGVHPTHIHANATCGGDGQAAGAHWDSPRGDNIGSGTGQITCDATMKGALVYMRPSANANTAWTIGGPTATNVIGHVLLVHGVNDTNQRHGCGPIMMK